MQTAPPSKILPLILCGGSGSRLWPLSRADVPKPFFSLNGSGLSLFQETILRVNNPQLFLPPLVIGNHTHRFIIAEQMQQMGIEAPQILLEPCARNTAPAITAAAWHIQLLHGNILTLALPADHWITDTAAFHRTVRHAKTATTQKRLMTFGITPQSADTGYGYIKRGKMLGESIYEVESFIEKPDAAQAKTLLQSGDHYWNSGMFLFFTDFLLQEMQRLNPQLTQDCRKAAEERSVDLGFIRLGSKIANTPAISIDYALMERTCACAMAHLDCGWADTGTWDARWQLAQKDTHGNAVSGECYLLSSEDCYAYCKNGQTIAAYGIKDLAIINTPEAVLIAPREDQQAVRALHHHLQALSPGILTRSNIVYRPWGRYEIIQSTERYQVKRLHIKPGGKLSLQKHLHRAEHWVVLFGTASVLCDWKEYTLFEDQSIYIPCGSIHRLENCADTPLEMLEIQTGDYVAEDDIIRFEDQYGRVAEDV